MLQNMLILNNVVWVTVSLRAQKLLGTADSLLSKTESSFPPFRSDFPNFILFSLVLRKSQHLQQTVT